MAPSLGATELAELFLRLAGKGTLPVSMVLIKPGATKFQRIGRQEESLLGQTTETSETDITCTSQNCKFRLMAVHILSFF